MKTKPLAPKRSAHRPAKAQKKAIKSSLRQRRAWHARLSLHPVSVMIQLCAGVLLVASTLTVAGDASYTVTATVPAVLPSSPALITSPSDSNHFANQALDVSGSCPNDAAYVELFQNGVYVGVSVCTTNTFEVSTLLDPGVNVLVSADYNVTNQAGPSGMPITVYYDVPVPPAPPASPTPLVAPESASVVPPVSLAVMQVDNNVPYVAQPQDTQLTTQQPVFSGIAPPYSAITLLLHSDPIYCRTQADAVGFWRCVVTQTLPVGTHSVAITAVTPAGKKLSLPVFHIQTIAELPAADQTNAGKGGAFAISTNYHYQVYMLGQTVPVNLVISGGVSPYALTINWGDGSTQTLLRASTSNSDIDHTYKWINTKLGSYTIKIQGTDSAGHISATQMIATLRNSAYHNVISGAAHGSGTLNLINDMHAWLWILWPGYAIVILMLISFWLGERQEYQLRLIKRPAKNRPKVRKRHA